MALAQVAAVTGGALVDPGTADVRVSGPVVTDSRQCATGSLYVARVGEHADGHEFLPQAAAAGAVAALVTVPTAGDLPQVLVADVQEAFASLATHVIASVPGLVVIGVTGSSGKTTTKDLLASVLSAHGETVANVGSLNSEVGVPLTVCRVSPTTRFLILEMGARGPGHIRYLTDMTHPSVGVVINVGSAHLGEFGSTEAIAAAKGELVEALPAHGLAVLNADDPLVAAMAGRTAADVVLVGEAASAAVQARDVRMRPDGAASYTLRLHGPQGYDDVPVDLRLLGRHQVGNSLAAAAVAARLGMPLPDIAAALSRAIPASRYRMERHDRADGVVVVNDAYNANPESMASALTALSVITPPDRPLRHRWAVLGQMRELGPEAAARHAEVGALAARLGIDRVLAVGTDSDTDDPAITRAILTGYADAGGAGRGIWADEAQQALAILKAEVTVGDVILVKSSNGVRLYELGEALVRAPQEVTS